MEVLKEKVMEHDFAIKGMAKSMQDLADTTKDSNLKLGDIAKSMGKQELILEKLTNLETTSKDSINRVHKRVDGLEEALKVVANRGEKDKGCTALRVAQQEDKTDRTELKSNIKSNQHRLDKMESHLVWVSRSIIGALITGGVAVLFYFVKH